MSDLVRDSAEDLSDESCYPNLSKATLIDQDSGEVYQVIRYNKILLFVLFCSWNHFLIRNVGEMRQLQLYFPVH